MTLSEPSDFGLAQWAERAMLWGMPQTLQTEYSGARDAGGEPGGTEAGAETAIVAQTLAGT